MSSAASNTFGGLLPPILKFLNHFEFDFKEELRRTDKGETSLLVIFIEYLTVCDYVKLKMLNW